MRYEFDLRVRVARDDEEKLRKVYLSTTTGSGSRYLTEAAWGGLGQTLGEAFESAFAELKTLISADACKEKR